MTVETVRKAVPLSPLELQLVERIRTAGTPVHAAMVDLIGAPFGRSEAAVLHALVQLGIRSVEERALERSYAGLAHELGEEPAAAGDERRDRRARREAARAAARL